MPVSDPDRLKLRGWAERRRQNYLRLALEMAANDEAHVKSPDAVELSYNKLKRLREEFEECKRVLTALD